MERVPSWMCYICSQRRPCNRQTTVELASNGHHERLIHPIDGNGVVAKAWSLGPVWITCCGHYYGMYYDNVAGAFQPMYLGGCEQQALNRMNHVKLFLADVALCLVRVNPNACTCQAYQKPPSERH